ncbi:MAG: DUF4956 domain-containing protein [Ruminococcus sp.]|nr:DUF4956 domain-containing protein [Ruminococcus sp.]
MVCTLVSIALGVLLALTFSLGRKNSKSMTTALVLLPFTVQVVIMLVNGNLGTGVAVMGAFSLVRFRSLPGNARDILAIFLAMAVGLCTGTNHILLAFLFAGIVCAITAVYTISPFGETKNTERTMTITIPESLDYSEVFDDLFKKYTRSCELTSVKTTNMGSLFKLRYNVELKKGVSEKEFIDELRVRNGNLEIVSAARLPDPEQL